MMETAEVHRYARVLVNWYGQKAEPIAASKALQNEAKKRMDDAQNWRRIQAAIRRMSNPEHS